VDNTTDFEIKGGHKLSGSIATNTSKNGALGLFCASLLNKNVTTLHGIPRIQEIYAELDANDRKYFRAVAEGDVARIAEWHNKQDALRDELKGLQ
jgi:UDP-N-acetylglucosamine enolpyruvyl transferase